MGLRQELIQVENSIYKLRNLGVPITAESEQSAINSLKENKLHGDPFLSSVVSGKNSYYSSIKQVLAKYSTFRMRALQVPIDETFDSDISKVIHSMNYVGQEEVNLSDYLTKDSYERLLGNNLIGVFSGAVVSNTVFFPTFSTLRQTKLA